jgi:DNA-binding NarL/FixJ family response regulator
MMNGPQIAPTQLQLPINVAIIEGHAIFGKALAYMFSSDEQFRVVAEIQRIDATTFEEVTPDVIVLDLDTHPVDLSETMRLCRLHAPNARICIFTQHLKPEVMQRCLAVGTDGFLLKDMLPADFMRAVKTVAEGISYVDPRVAGRILRRRSEANSVSDELSLRELDIVRLIADGLSNKEISARLFLSEKTIKNHTSRIFTKFGVSARTQVAVYALKAGLV